MYQLLFAFLEAWIPEPLGRSPHDFDWTNEMPILVPTEFLREILVNGGEAGQEDDSDSESVISEIDGGMTRMNRMYRPHDSEDDFSEAFAQLWGEEDDERDDRANDSADFDDNFYQIWADEFESLEAIRRVPVIEPEPENEQNESEEIATIIDS